MDALKKKVRTVGRRYSKKALTTIAVEDGETFDNDEVKKLLSPPSFKDHLEDIKRWSLKTLIASGLETSPIVSSDKKNEVRTQVLNSYVLSEGFKHDSPEYLAAKILTILRLKQPIDRSSYELGTFVTLARVYGLESSSNSVIASKKRKKPWALALAVELVEKYIRFPDAWGSIPENEGDTYEGYEVWKEGEYLRASGKSDERLKKEAFRVGYFQEVKKSKKKS